jgi:hypothetical protein
MTWFWFKPIGLLAFVVLVFTWACGSGDSPTSTSSFQEATSISSQGSLSTATEALNEVANEEVENDVICARSPGFYCQNQSGKNPNMSQEQFQTFADQAARLLSDVEALDTPEEIAAAVCDPSDQLFRHLSTLALNLSSMRIDASDPHGNPNYATIGDAFAHGVAVAGGDVTREERKEVKRLIEQITGDRLCEEDEYEDPDEDPDANPGKNPGKDPGEDPDENPGGDPGVDPPTAPVCEELDEEHPGKILICHKGKNTLSISPDAWPAHWAHGDDCGACGGS